MKPEEEKKVNGNDNNELSSVEQTIKAVLADGHSFLHETTITAIETQKKTGRASQKEYLNAFITILDPMKAAKKMPDNTVQMGYLGAFQTPFGQLAMVMRRSTFYGRYVAYVQEAAEAGENFANDYFAGTRIKLLAQFVAAGETAHNPFQRNAENYEVQNYDRFVYHVIGIANPVDPLTIDAYRQLNTIIRQDMLAAVRARRDAAKISVLASVTPSPAVAAGSTELPM